MEATPNFVTSFDDPSLPDCDTLWKIAEQSEIDLWRSTGKFSLVSPLDVGDGFFHCTNSYKVKLTASNFFKGNGSCKMVKLTPRKWASTKRVIKIMSDEPKQEDIEGDEIFIRYLLREGIAACHHIYLDNEKHPLDTDLVIDPPGCPDQIYDMPWNEEKEEHEFPGLDSVQLVQ